MIRKPPRTLSYFVITSLNRDRKVPRSFILPLSPFALLVLWTPVVLAVSRPC